MTITEAITKADRLCPNNAYTQAEKTAWLNQIDTQIKQEIIDVREGADQIPFSGYDSDTDPGAALLVPPPYDELYIFYLKAQMELYNGDINAYNASVAVFNSQLQGFRNQYNRLHGYPNVPLRF